MKNYYTDFNDLKSFIPVKIKLKNSIELDGYLVTKRIKPSSVPSTIHRYSIRHSEYDDRPATIENTVYVNWHGDLLLSEPIEFENKKDQYVEIENFHKYKSTRFPEKLIY